jgi:hypothetical protein
MPDWIDSSGFSFVISLLSLQPYQGAANSQHSSLHARVDDAPFHCPTA